MPAAVDTQMRTYHAWYAAGSPAWDPKIDGTEPPDTTPTEETR